VISAALPPHQQLGLGRGSSADLSVGESKKCTIKCRFQLLFSTTHVLDPTIAPTGWIAKTTFDWTIFIPSATFLSYLCTCPSTAEGNIRLQATNECSQNFPMHEK
jgi:hypothetical protein